MAAEPAIQIRNYEAALERSPNLDAARLGLAVQLTKARRFDEAEQQFRAYLARKPGDASALVGLGRDYADRLPHELSGGEQRRVALARALAPRPRLVLLDEPFSGLASNEREHLRDLLARLRDDEDLAIVLVEHDVDVVARLANRIAVLDFGNKIADGTPDEVLARPEVRKAYFGVVEVTET